MMGVSKCRNGRGNFAEQFAGLDFRSANFLM